MKKVLAALPLAALLVPLAASAHQTAVYRIGHDEYRIVVGSQNEPITVDDKTGIELEISLAEGASTASDDHHETGGAVAGLENSLKVEIIAGDKKKILDLRPTYGETGSYYAPFYPTVATTYSYRLFGEIEETPVDLTFTCRAEGEAAANETEEKEISPGVVQISKTGGFGCPSAKEGLGFPEASESIVRISGKADTGRMLGGVALALSALALVFSLRRR